MSTETVTAVRAKECGHVLASASHPLQVRRITETFNALAADDDRFELVEISVGEAVDAYVAGLDCTRCVIEVPDVR